MTDEQFAAIITAITTASSALMKAISEVQTRVYALEFVVGQLGGRIELSKQEQLMDRNIVRGSQPIRFKMPTYCMDCGAYLMGGATAHKPGCPMQAMIDDTLNQMGSKGPGQ